MGIDSRYPAPNFLFRWLDVPIQRRRPRAMIAMRSPRTSASSILYIEKIHVTKNQNKKKDKERRRKFHLWKFRSTSEGRISFFFKGIPMGSKDNCAVPFCLHDDIPDLPTGYRIHTSCRFVQVQNRRISNLVKIIYITYLVEWKRRRVQKRHALVFFLNMRVHYTERSLTVSIIRQCWYFSKLRFTMDIASDSRRLIPPLKALTLVFDTCISPSEEESSNQSPSTSYGLYARLVHQRTHRFRSVLRLETLFRLTTVSSSWLFAVASSPYTPFSQWIKRRCSRAVSSG